MENKPDLSEEVEIVITGLTESFQLYKYLMYNFRPDIPQDISASQLNHSHWRTLMFLVDRGRASMKEACRFVGLEAGSFTPVADKLIKLSLAERARDPEDRRKVFLEITDKGRTLGFEIKRQLRVHFKERLSELNRFRINELAAAMSVISEINKTLVHE